MAAHRQWLVSHAPSVCVLICAYLTSRHCPIPTSESEWCRFSGGSILYALLFVHLSSKICKSSSLSLYGPPRSATPERIMSRQSPPSISQHAPRNNPHGLTSDANIRNFAPVARIMKTALPENAKIAKEAKECMQECVSEFISFITSEGPPPFAPRRLGPAPLDRDY